MPELPNFRTRDFVTMWGTIDERAVLLPGEPLAFASGRQGGFGPQASCAAAEQVTHIADSVTAANPATKVVVMGDLNDDATDDEHRRGPAAPKGKHQGGSATGRHVYNPFIEPC